MYKKACVVLSVALIIVTSLYLNEIRPTEEEINTSNRNAFFIELEAYLGQSHDLLLSDFPEIHCLQQKCRLNKSETMATGVYQRNPFYDRDFNGIEFGLEADDSVSYVMIIQP